MLLQSKMKSKRHNALVVATVGMVAIVLTHAFTIGYGIGFQSRGKALLAIEQAKQYNPSHLTIHYERKMHDKQDILRLEIDTTYRTIGKGEFRYEVICDRVLAMHSSCDESFTTTEAEQCFIEGAVRKWTTHNAYKTIEGYRCHVAAANDNNSSWLAWYTNELPRSLEGTTITDGLKGLILHVENVKKGYLLHATKIDIEIG